MWPLHVAWHSHGMAASERSSPLHGDTRVQVSQTPGRGPHCFLECSLGRYIGSIHPLLLVRAITAHLYISGGGISTTSHERTVQSHCRINSTCGETVYYSHLQEISFAAHYSRRAQEEVLLNVTTPRALVVVVIHPLTRV